MFSIDVPAAMSQQRWNALRVVCAFLAIVAVVAGVMSVPRSWAVSPESPGAAQVTVKGEHDEAITVGLTLQSAGLGPEPEKGEPCFMQTGNGYAEDNSDTSTTDGRVCAGGPVTYVLAVSSETGTDPVSVDITFFWDKREANKSMAIAVAPASESGNEVQKLDDNKYRVTIPGTNKTNSLTLSAKVPKAGTHNHAGQYPLVGEYTLGARVQPVDSEGNDLPPDNGNGTITTRTIKVLRSQRFDLSTSGRHVGDFDETIDGVKYRRLTVTPQVNAVQPNTKKWNHQAIGANQSTTVPPQKIRFTLDKNSFPESFPEEDFSKVLVQFNNEDPTPAPLDSGSPYLERKGERSLSSNYYNTPQNVDYTFLVPVKNLPKQPVELAGFFTVVDDEGNPTKIRGFNGPSDFPELADNAQLGGNVVDPGTGQDKDFSTADQESGLISGTKENRVSGNQGGYPNNNWAKFDVDLTEWQCPEGENCEYSKEDANSNSVIHDGDKTYPRGQAAVRLRAYPQDLRDNPRFCVAWKPGHQLLSGDAKIHLGDSPSGATTVLTSVFPGVRIFATNRDLLGDGNRPDCSNEKGEFVAIWDSANNLDRTGKNGMADVFGPGTGYGDTSGFLIEFPGALADVGSPVTLSYSTMYYDATTIGPDQPTTSNGNYFLTTNYFTMSQGGGEFGDVKQAHIAQAVKPTIHNQDNNTSPRPGTVLKTTGAGRQRYNVVQSSLMKINGSIARAMNTNRVEDGRTIANRFNSRLYLSTCLRVDETELPAGYVYHRPDVLENDYDKCSLSKEHYIERTWLLGDRENTTGDPLNDPVFPRNYSEKHPGQVNGEFWLRDSAPAKFAAPVYTPEWALPTQRFDMLADNFVDGASHIKDPTATKDDDRYYPRNYIDPQTYYPGAGASWPLSIEVPSLSLLSAQKIAYQDQIPKNHEFTHVAQIINTTEGVYPNFEFIDVFPYSGDGKRGSVIHGDYWLTAVPSASSPGQPPFEVYYTTDKPSTVSQCPPGAQTEDERESCRTNQNSRGKIDNAPSDTNWQLLTPEIVQNYAGVNKSKRITAVYIKGTGLNGNTGVQVQFPFATFGNHNDDTYVNSIGPVILPIAGTTAASPIPAPAAARTKVIANTISGTVYDDANSSADKNDGENGYPGVEVQLLGYDEESDSYSVAHTVHTNSSGQYSFENLLGGKFKVRIANPDTSRVEITESGRFVTNRGTGESAPIELPTAQRKVVENLDFGLFTPVPKIAVTKTVNGKKDATIATGAPGVFVIVGRNTGNTPLADVSLVDTWVDGKKPLELTCEITNGEGNPYEGEEVAAKGNVLEGTGVLAVGDSFTCKGSYNVTQDDVDSPSLETLPNKAAATGTYTGQIGTRTVSDEATATITPYRSGSIELNKNVVGKKPIYVADDEVNYTFTVTNTGTVTLDNVVISDPMLGENNPVTCDQTTLAPEAFTTCHAGPYVVTAQAQPVAEVTNTAEVSADRSDGRGHVSDDASATITVGQPGLAITKTSDADGQKKRKGDKITWTITVTNSGTTPVEGVTVTDKHLADKGVALDCDPSGLTSPSGVTLQPGSYTCTGTETVTQQQLDSEKNIVNTANAKGRYGEWAGTATASAEVKVSDKAGIAVEKTVLNKQDEYTVGEQLFYRFVVANTGDVTLKKISLDDRMLATAGVAITCEQQDKLKSLAPGESVTCFSGGYTITKKQARLKPGVLANHVDVSSVTPSNNTPVTGSAEASVSTGVPHLKVSKKARRGQEITAAGQTALFDITVTNNGGVDLDNVVITDPVVTDHGGSLTCQRGTVTVNPARAGALAKNKQITCVASYKVTQDDIDALAALDSTVIDRAFRKNTLPNTVTVGATFHGTPIKDVSDKAKVHVKVPASVDIIKRVPKHKSMYVAGNKVTYAFTVRNNGKITLTDVAVTDPMVGKVTCEKTILAPGEVTACHADPVTLTQEMIANATEVNRRKVVPNTAGVTARAGAASVTDSASKDINVGTPDLSVAITADKPDTPRVAGDTITWTIKVTNTGNTKVNNVRLSDEMVGVGTVLTCPEKLLNGTQSMTPGQTMTCIVTTTVTQADVDADTSIDNTATVTGGFGGKKLAADAPQRTSTATVALRRDTRVAIVKTIDGKDPAVYEKGDTAHFKFRVTNTGTVTLNDVEVIDDLEDVTLSGCGPKSVAPGDSFTCFGTYVVKEEDARGEGKITNTARAAGIPANDSETITSDDSSVDMVAGTPSLTLEKTAFPAGPLNAQDTTRFTFTVRNTGTTVVKKVRLKDPWLRTRTGSGTEAGAIECPEEYAGLLNDGGAELQPGDEVVCHADVTVGQDDIDHGADFVNEAILSGSFNDRQLDPVKSEATVTINADAKISFAKSVLNEQTLYAPGQTVDYQLQLTNTGTQTLTNVTVADAMAKGLHGNGSGSLSCTHNDEKEKKEISFPLSSFPPGDSYTCTYSIEISVQQGQRGSIVNKASVTAEKPGDTPGSPSISSTSSTTVTTGVPDVSVEKTVSPVKAKRGEALTWKIKVTNTGTTPLTSVLLGDEASGAHNTAPLDCDQSAFISTGDPDSTTADRSIRVLPIGGVITCTMVSTVTQADLDSGKPVTNNASVIGSFGTAKTKEKTSTATVELDRSVSVSLNKEVVSATTAENNSLAEGEYVLAGDTVNYRFTVTNTGTVSVTDISINDDMSFGTGPVCSENCDGLLAPGAKRVFTASHTVTEDEAAAPGGFLDNTATAQATPPWSEEPVFSEQSSATVAVGVPAIAVDKTVEGPGTAGVGDALNYTITVKNTGNTPLKEVTLSDPMFAEGELTCDNDAIVGAGAAFGDDGGADAITCTGTHVVTQEEVDSGKPIDNTATATGSYRGNKVEDSSTTSSPVSTKAAVEVEKTVANLQPFYLVGDTVPYRVQVTNTGEVSLKDFSLFDSTNSGRAVTLRCPKQSLGSGESMVCLPQPEFTVTQGDADFLATSTDGGLVAEFGRSLINSVTVNASPVTVNASPVTGGVVTGGDTTPITVGTPGLSISKKALDGETANKAGDTITWLIEVTNTGSTPVTGVTIADPEFGATPEDVRAAVDEGRITCGDSNAVITGAGITVPVGGSMTCRLTSTVDQDMVDRQQKIINTAAVTGTSGTKTLTPPSASAEVPVSTRASLVLTKSVVDNDSSRIFRPGDTVTYRFILRNTGDVTLTNPTINDEMVAGSTSLDACNAPSTLAPGGVRTCDVAYVLTDRDVPADGGTLTNTAAAVATAPTAPEEGSDIPGSREINSGVDSATIPVGRPGLAVDKTARIIGKQPGDRLQAGNTVAYTFVVTNTGSVPLNHVTLSDPLLTDRRIIPTCDDVDAAEVFGPGAEGIDLNQNQVVRCQAQVVATQADIDAGVDFVNEVTVHGNSYDTPLDPATNPSMTSSTVTPVSDLAALNLKKTVVDLKDLYVSGEQFGYRFTLRNTGDVSLHGITIDDPSLGDAADNITCSLPVDPTAPAPGAGTPAADTAEGTGDTEPARVAPQQLVLAPGDTAVCLSPQVTVTDGQAAAGRVVNTARAEGTPPVRADATTPDPVVSNESTASVTTGVPSVTITKTADTGDSDKPGLGEKIRYSVRVHNDGTTPLHRLRVTDSMFGGDNPLDCGTVVGGALTDEGMTLPVDGQFTCTGTHTVTQDDLDRSVSLVNTASVSGSIGDKTATGSSTVATPINGIESLELDKFLVSEARHYTEGETITYGFRVRNTGSRTLFDIGVTDPLTGAVTCPEQPLKPGQTVECSAAELTVTPEQASRGQLTNTATATGATLSGEEATGTSSVETATGYPGLFIGKTADTEGPVNAGDVIGWTITVRNNGTTPLSNVVVTDAAAGLENLSCSDQAALSGTGADLVTGGTITCRGTTTVTQEHLDKQTAIVNTASAVGRFNDIALKQLTASATVPVAARAGITVTKTVDGHTNGHVYRAGDEIVYRFTVTNTGTVTLDGLTVNDGQLAELGTTVDCPDTRLAPGGSVECFSGPVTVTAQQARSGEVINTASVSALTPADRTPVVSDPSTSTVPAAEGALAIDKDADRAAGLAAGDSVVFSLRVSNTSPVAVDHVVVADPLITDAGGSIECPVLPGLVTADGATLAAGTTVGCVARYTITDADQQGQPDLTNTATATGSIDGVPVGPVTADKTVTFDQRPSISLTKTVADPAKVYTEGDKVVFIYTVTNNGTTPLTGISVADPSVASVTCEKTDLAVGETMQCRSAGYTVTARDAARGSFGGPATSYGSIPGSMLPAVTDRTVDNQSTLSLKAKQHPVPAREENTTTSSAGWLIPLIPAAVIGGIARLLAPTEPAPQAPPTTAPESPHDHAPGDTPRLLAVTGANVLVVVPLSLLLIGAGLVLLFATGRKRHRNR
ncbi:SdrD B-like domain-containing protein [Corynebacterium mendelii]|uniref:DUF11 domain-containing protein n=1 Tax=Corynebacterium mendelii TaxID=2765362 RepID=A0A939E428_9CORY|nr:SdrD B-like domain-containing protein [Corynebacterium mendelii]MBN9645252.1 DUF11 domain-containing protein [Corynebacterium mendelii]